MALNAYSHMAGTVERLQASTRFQVQPDGDSKEWFRLRSSVLSDKQLFQMLQAIWPAIVGRDPQKFALIHCQGGRHAGVWFHLLPNAEYEPGCHEVASL